MNIKHPATANYLVFSFAMLLLSSSGFLGRSLTIAPPLTIWWRAAIALVLLGSYCVYQGLSFKLVNNKQKLAAVTAGVLMAVHLVTYFYALQWSNVAVAMLAVFTFPAMTTLLEPLLLKKPFQSVHLLLGLLVLIGIYFLAPEFDLQNDITAGLLMGLVSAFVFSLRNILLKTQVDGTEASILMFYQMLVVIVLLLPVLFIYAPIPPTNQFPALLSLGLFTTAIGHTLFVNSFKRFSITTASLMSSVQPVLGILLGVLFLREIPDLTSVVGGVIIVTTVVIEALRSRK